MRRMTLYCPDCDNKSPEFETHFLYAVYMRVSRSHSTLRYEKVGYYCKKCKNFFVYDNEKEKPKLKEPLQIVVRTEFRE